MAFDSELRVALDAVREAAKLCERVRAESGHNTRAKGDRSPVTVADFGSQALVCRRLQAAFPDDLVIGEEDSAALRESPDLLNRVVHYVRACVGDVEPETVCGWIDRGAHRTPAPRIWTLDPIDGTKGYIRGDQYAVALALLVDGRPVVAAMACPSLPYPTWDSKVVGTVFGATADIQAFQASLRDSEEEQSRASVSVSGTRDFADVRFCESFESLHSAHGESARLAAALGITRPPLRLDSQTKYGVVARGEADFYLRVRAVPGYVENIWDHAAGVLIVEQAGGRVSDIDGKPLDFARGRHMESNNGVLVTNSRLHSEIVAGLSSEGIHERAR